MRLGRCPVCHAALHLDALVQDEAGRELLAIFVGLPDGLGRALVAYMGLWRPAKSDLSNARALNLAREVLVAGAASREALEVALWTTVEALRAKGEARALRNHNYLLRVLADAKGAGAVALPGGACAVGRAVAAPPQSRTAAAMMALEAAKRGPPGRGADDLGGGPDHG